jgi:guanylate kinase
MTLENPNISNLIRAYNCPEGEDILLRAKDLGVSRINDDLFEITANTCPVHDKSTDSDSLVVVITGVSGAGKDSLAEELDYNENFGLVRSYTTRARRSRELRDPYQRINEEEFLRKKERGEFLETCKRGNVYMGLDREAVDIVLRKGKVPVIKTGPQAVGKIRYLLPDLSVISFFVIPQSWRSLEKRLVARDVRTRTPSERLQTKEDVRFRLERNRMLLEYIPKANYLLINRDGNLPITATHVREIVDEFKSGREL